MVGNNKVVLVVEDYPQIARLLKLILERQGYKVQVASNGLEGLNMVRQSAPHVVVLNYTMPIMDGIEMLRRLKSNPETAPIPVLFNTCRKTRELTEQAMSLGVEMVIELPFDPSELVAIVNRLAGLSSATELTSLTTR